MACNKIHPGLKARTLFAFVLGALLVSACTSQHRQTTPTLPVDTAAAPKKEITIALLGATGMVGGFILNEALSRGYDIRALARTPQKLAAFEQKITVVKGDARDFSAINTLLQGSQVVISTLGPVKADGNAAIMLSTTATANIVQLMPAHNIERYIVVSGAAVRTPSDKRKLTGWLLRQGASITLNETLKDKQAEYQLLAGSPLAWTLVRCPLIDPEPVAQEASAGPAPLYQASLETPSSFRLRAGDLARFIVDQIDSGEYLRQAPFLSSH
ncbi:MAG: NAD(P)H-binding protein [Proteobacteria bacterium]|nr:NAD(P)H-binding protein [Pseudomonadota bacterium]